MLHVAELKLLEGHYSPVKFLKKVCNIFKASNPRYFEQELAQRVNNDLVLGEEDGDLSGLSEEEDEDEEDQGVVQQQEHPQQQQDDELCIVCIDRPSKECVFIPCGHQRFCLQCAMRLKGRPCPFCRTVVNDVLKLF